MFARVVVFLSIALTAANGYAQDDAKAIEKQKAGARNALIQSGVEKPSTVETADLLVYSSLPEIKTKAIAAAAQKTFAFARAALNFDDKETYWPGKLTLYVIPDWRGYSELLRTLARRKPDKGEVAVTNVRIDTPFVAVGVDLGERPTDAEVQSAAGTWVAAVLLNKKAGLSSTTDKLPEWLQVGFGRAAYLRAGNNSSKMAAYRAKAKTLAVGARTRLPAKLSDAWAAARDKDYDTLVTSVADFLAFGPEGSKFPTILMGFKPTETQPMPTVDTAFAAVEWKVADVENAWRVWVVRGSK
ncbi:MAG TPA: hypothetical protein VGJ05_02150 [Fimbriiglobus sp.]|jgi:hypothetical protein